MSAAQGSTENTWPPVLVVLVVAQHGAFARNKVCSCSNQYRQRNERAASVSHEDKAARARKHAWMLGSCMQVQNIIELWHLTAAPPVDDRVSLEVESAELHACLHEAGHNVFSDCREKLERPSEAGTTMLTVWSYLTSSHGLDKDGSHIASHGNLVLLFLAPTEWKASTKHRMASWLVHVLLCRWLLPAAAVVHF